MKISAVGTLHFILFSTCNSRVFGRKVNIPPQPKPEMRSPMKQQIHILVMNTSQTSLRKSLKWSPMALMNPKTPSTDSVSSFAVSSFCANIVIYTVTFVFVWPEWQSAMCNSIAKRTLEQKIGRARPMPWFLTPSSVCLLSTVIQDALRREQKYSTFPQARKKMNERAQRCTRAKRAVSESVSGWASGPVLSSHCAFSWLFARLFARPFALTLMILSAFHSQDACGARAAIINSRWGNNLRNAIKCLVFAIW